LIRDFQGEMAEAVAALGEAGFREAVEAGLAYLSGPEFDGTAERAPQALARRLRPSYGRHSRAVGIIVLARWLEG
jgi:hypothetical protein